MDENIVSSCGKIKEILLKGTEINNISISPTTSEYLNHVPLSERKK